MVMPGRSYTFNGNSSLNKYRFAWNGAEVIDEIYGRFGTYDLGARMYNPRLGRMFSTDPRESEYAWQSTYAYYANSPIWQIDYNGEGEKWERFKSATAGVIVGVVTNIAPIPIRDLYNPAYPDEYNSALQSVDNTAMVLGEVMAKTGGTGLGTSAVGLGLGATLKLSGVGAPVGVPLMGASAVAGEVSANVGVGGIILMANSATNKQAGYNYGNASQPRHKPVPQKQFR